MHYSRGFKILILIITFLFFIGCYENEDWQSASRESANIATPAKDMHKAVFQIYSARAFSWRKYFGVHTWIAWKSTKDSNYTIAQVTSWHLDYTGSSVNVQQDIPDRYWYGEKPVLLYEVFDNKAEQLIVKTKELIDEYPFKSTYKVWPGPNSNSFISYIIRKLGVIKTELPPEAIGKDFLGNNFYVTKSLNGSGLQISAWGLIGITLGSAEGIELNILGLCFGIDIFNPAIKLPFWGRIGAEDSKDE